MSSEEELAARLDEDEAAAKAAEAASPWKAADYEGEHWIVTDANGDPLIYDEGTPSLNEAAHIARHDPARALRFVDAVRAIIRESNGEGHGWAEHEPAYYAGLSFAVIALAGAYDEG